MIEFLGFISERVIIFVFRRVYDIYGVLEVVKLDNGLLFNSYKFEEYVWEEGFKY